MFFFRALLVFFSVLVTIFQALLIFLKVIVFLLRILVIFFFPFLSSFFCGFLSSFFCFLSSFFFGLSSSFSGSSSSVSVFSSLSSSGFQSSPEAFANVVIALTIARCAPGCKYLDAFDFVWRFTTGLVTFYEAPGWERLLGQFRPDDVKHRRIFRIGAPSRLTYLGMNGPRRKGYANDCAFKRRVWE